MQRMMKNLKQNAALPLSLLAALTMAGCNETGTSSLGSSEDEHDHAESDHPGRLVITADDDGTQLYMYDLEAGALLPGTLSLDHDASALYTSPGKRFVLAVQRDDNQVQIVDGGLYLHDDHVDEVIPTFAGTLTGPAPTHFRVHGEQAALFYDGDADNAVMAQVELLTDESLETASSEASQTLASAHHGVAEPRGDVLLATFRTAASGLPETVDIYHQHGDHYHKEDTIAPTCPDLHGAGSNEDYSVFGCSDGILIVHQDGEDFSAEKITNATLGLAAGERIGSFDSHHELSHFVGYAGDSIYIIHPEDGDAEALDWTEGAAVSLESHRLDPHGEHLVLLDDAGDLRIFHTADWSEHAHVEDAIAPGNTQMAVAGEPAHVFLSDTDNNSIVVVHLEEGSLESPLSLTFPPAALAWVGLDSDHEEDHGDEDEHNHDDDDHDHNH